MLNINAHIHLPPNFSAFETVAQAIELAGAENIAALGVSNYYDYGVYNEFSHQALAQNIFPLFGTEIIALLPELAATNVRINDPGNPGKMYLCGKGVTHFHSMTDTARRLLDTIRRNDSERMAQMTNKLRALCDAADLKTDLDEAVVKESVVRRHHCPTETVFLQERHVAQAFQEVIFAQVAPAGRTAFLHGLFGAESKAPEDAVTVQNEIRSHLMKAGKPAFVAETFVGFDSAYRLIVELGGIPCYPVLADGAKPICEFEQSPEQLINELTARGVFCAEFIPGRNTPDVLSRYVRAFRDANFVVTAGTEHNTRDLIALTPTCADGVPIPDEIQELFEQGACVIAAHQDAVRQGAPGFVPGETPITDFAARGRAMIQAANAAAAGE